MNLKDLETQLNNATNKMELYAIAGQLNNLPEHVNTDKVTFMAFLDFNEAIEYTKKMLNTSKGVK